MKLLIDTHILLWRLTDDAKLPKNARQLISTPDNAIFVSHASLWEIQIKAMAGKLTPIFKTLSNSCRKTISNNCLSKPTIC